MKSGIDVNDFGVSSRVPFLTKNLEHANKIDPSGAAIRKAIENVCDPRSYIDDPDAGKNVVDYMNLVLGPDNFAISVQTGAAKLRLRSPEAFSPDQLSAATQVIGFHTTQADFNRALENIDSDPEDAITSACSMLESVCRSIIVEANVAMPAKKDISTLYKLVSEILNLRTDISVAEKMIESDVRRILGGLASVVNGIGELRTHGGDAHGREHQYAGLPKARYVDKRIARMSVNASATVCLFLIETWKLHKGRDLVRH
jgi:hypothetical protein